MADNFPAVTGVWRIKKKVISKQCSLNLHSRYRNVKIAGICLTYAFYIWIYHKEHSWDPGETILAVLTAKKKKKNLILQNYSSEDTLTRWSFLAVENKMEVIKNCTEMKLLKFLKCKYKNWFICSIKGWELPTSNFSKFARINISQIFELIF